MGELLQKITIKELTGLTLVWKEGMAEWTPLASVPELAQSLNPTATPLPATAANTPVPVAPAMLGKPSKGANASASGIRRMYFFNVEDIFKEALTCFKKNAQNLCLVVVVYLAIAIVLSVIPFIGPLAGIFVNAFLMLGLWKVGLAAVDGQPIQVGMLFSYSKLWWKAGLANLALSLTVGGFALLLLVPGLIVSVLFFCWGLLVVDKGLPPFQALNESYHLVKPRLLTWVMLSLISLIAVVVGLICLVVGVIPAMALIVILACVAYRRINPRVASVV
jgi:hypothetical protein